MIIHGGIYYIQSRLNGKQVDVYGGGTNNGTNIHLWTLNKTNAQKFKVIKDDSYYSFLSLCDESKAIDGGGNEFNIHIWDYSKNNDNQKWELKLIEDEWYSLICKSNNRVMDVAFCHMHDGANIFCSHEHHYKGNQQFRFININNEFFDSSILTKVNFSCTIRQAGCTQHNIIQNYQLMQQLKEMEKYNYGITLKMLKIKSGTLLVLDLILII